MLPSAHAHDVLLTECPMDIQNVKRLQAPTIQFEFLILR